MVLKISQSIKYIRDLEVSGTQKPPCCVGVGNVDVWVIVNRFPACLASCWSRQNIGKSPITLSRNIPTHTHKLTLGSSVMCSTETYGFFDPKIGTFHLLTLYHSCGQHFLFVYTYCTKHWWWYSVIMFKILLDLRIRFHLDKQFHALCFFLQNHGYCTLQTTGKCVIPSTQWNLRDLLWW